MGFLGLILVLAADEPVESLAKKMMPIYVKEVEAFSLAVEPVPQRALELKKEPIFEWSNPVRSGVQQGVVFLWLRDGRPAALASIFSSPSPTGNGRQITHELHALDAEKLLVKRDGFNQWKPQAGLTRKELTDAAPPAATAGTRRLQMQRLAQDFAGHSIDPAGKRWELRRLPTPLFRYPAAKTGVVDGALFTLMSTAGTDPEVLLLIEAREDDGKLHWEYACGRFSDWELHIQRKGKEVWSSVPSDENPMAHDRLHLYRLFSEKIVTLDGKVLARIRQTPRGTIGTYDEIIPVDDK
jgi:hypothetical protein